MIQKVKHFQNYIIWLYFGQKQTGTHLYTCLHTRANACIPFHSCAYVQVSKYTENEKNVNIFLDDIYFNQLNSLKKTYISPKINRNIDIHWSPFAALCLFSRYWSCIFVDKINKMKHTFCLRCKNVMFLEFPGMILVSLFGWMSTFLIREKPIFHVFKIEWINF